MNRFVAYFDILGYKRFLANTPFSETRRWVESIFLNAELAISKGKTVEKGSGFIADLSTSKVNSTIFSDTIVFWTDDDLIEEFVELLEVAYGFYWRMMQSTFPVRGYLNYGEVGVLYGNPTAKYRVISVYGKEALRAHEMSESMQIAAAVIDKSVWSRINEEDDFEKISKDMVVKYPIPFIINKNTIEYRQEYCLKILNNSSGVPAFEAYENYKRSLERNFTYHDSSSLESHSILKKYENTIRFLKYVLIDVFD